MMTHQRDTKPGHRAMPAAVGIVLAALGLAGCGPVPATQGIQDPYEEANRNTHQLNLGIDKYVIRPLARGAGHIIPEPVFQGVSNFAGNLDLPGTAVNDVLQLKLDQAANNTLRFAVNSTIGIAGLFDPATAIGLPEMPTDFGQTLSVWGMGEGNYMELPFVGPSTERDALGKVVDYALDPTRLFVPRNKNWIVTAAHLGAKIGDRSRYSETVDSILYESADSYAQARLIYLEHRRHDLGQTTAASEFEDPYAK